MPELWSERFTREQLMRRVGGIQQVAGVRLMSFEDGIERGGRVLEFRTGTGFEFDVLVDRAFDIGRCELSGRALGWQSGVGFGAPWFTSEGDFGWLRNWGGGLLTTCGLEHALFPATDTAEHYHWPGRSEERFGLHGRVSGRPARLTGYGERWDGDECTLWAEGEVLQAAQFGEHLLLRRRIEAKVGENRLNIHDVVENVGWDPTPHMYLYHINVGFPVLDEGAELLVPASKVVPAGDYDSSGYRLFRAPEAGHSERVFEHVVIGEADGSVPVAVVNRARQLGAYEVFNRNQLLVQFLWRMLGEGSYVVGIEPSTNRPPGRTDAKEHGELIVLKPGEQRTYDLELGALSGSVEIDAFAARVAALGGI